MKVYLVLSYSSDGDPTIWGIFSNPKKAREVAKEQYQEHGSEEAAAIEWELDGVRLGDWVYNRNSDGTYYGED